MSFPNSFQSGQLVGGLGGFNEQVGPADQGDSSCTSTADGEISLGICFMLNHGLSQGIFFLSGKFYNITSDSWDQLTAPQAQSFNLVNLNGLKQKLMMMVKIA